MAELEEGTGESSSPPRGFRGGVHVLCDIRNQIYARLVESGCEEAVADPDRFRKQLEAHFDRFPESYSLDVHAARAEDVLLHQKILAESEDPKNRPVFHVRFLKNDDMQPSPYIGSSSEGCHSNGNKGDLPPNRRIEFEPCSRLEDLNLNMRKISKDIEDRSDPSEALSTRNDIRHVPIHEITFSSIDKPKVLCQLSAVLSDVGLNIREAHVFSTLDGYCLDVFVVDGWFTEGTDDLLKELREAATRNNVLLSGSLHSSASGRILELHQRVADTDIDTKFLKMGEKIAVGSCGDLFRGTYLGLDVAIKVLRSERLSEALQVEFDQEVMILRKVDHINVVRFYGACTKPPDLCIITAILVNKVSFSLTGCPISLIQSTDSEYMHGGNLYDYLHKQERVLELSVLLKIAIDVCKGMDYLHKNNIIHRDLKTANLLIDRNQVVKVADFGVARFQSQKGIMTAETGTYRWMAPEVINHKHYDFKADVFSFAIVLWELATSKVPYENLTPLQAALGVRLGMRPELPNDRHPRLLDLMQRCWQENPDIRSSFPEILIELEELLQQVQANGEANQQSKTKIQKKSQNK
ncbi:serine/threonine-protein kinase STY8-like isoform X2 [Ananas comosus]|uniref:Serine/threonine-protein kinase STY8-like isoform X2 n=1 Tax=Ananas comosus TaxID=4615 RepID=A0A6P5EYM6_ANACO|nr:serine/threonine-protein kinase STY8-like isoform X2 [Ananas comosus]